MIESYKDIDSGKKPKFLMPTSLRLIKECATFGIDWKGLHIIDLLSLIYSFRIDNVKKKKEYDRQKRMQEMGISSVRKANANDFNSL